MKGFQLFFSRVLVLASLSLAHGLKAQKIPDCGQTPSSAVHYDTEAMKAKFHRFIDSLSAFKIIADYPGAVRKILSSQKEKQLEGLKLLGESHEPEIMPWLVSFMHSEDLDLQWAAYSAMEELITHFALKRRDPSTPELIRIVAPAKEEIDLSPLAWPIFWVLNNPSQHQRLIASAAFSCGYLLLNEFKPLLEKLLHNEHPANQHAAKTALEIIANSVEK